jgi:hypothetical protein
MTRSQVRLVIAFVLCSSRYDNRLQNRQAHFGHPIIASTCKLFYFDKWSDVSTFDRDTFHGSVPEQLVALVGAVVGRFFIQCMQYLTELAVPERFGRVVQRKPYYEETRDQALQSRLSGYIGCNGDRRQ